MIMKIDVFFSIQKGIRKKRAIPDFMPKAMTDSNTMYTMGSAGLSLPSDNNNNNNNNNNNSLYYAHTHMKNITEQQTCSVYKFQF